jgi:hypothetical protein
LIAHQHLKIQVGDKMSSRVEWDPAKAATNLRKHQVSLSMHERLQTMSENSTKKSNDDYELREEYDLSQLPVMPKGRYAPERRVGSNVVVLDPDVAQAFPTDESVNAALRLILQIAQIPQTAEAS